MSSESSFGWEWTRTSIHAEVAEPPTESFVTDPRYGVLSAVSDRVNGPSNLHDGVAVMRLDRSSEPLTSAAASLRCV